MNPFENADKIAWLQGLLIQCPLQDEEEDCPAKELRRVPLGERMKMVNDMSEEEIDSIIEHHIECIRRRENE